MNRLQKITLDKRCKKITAVIAGLLFALILLGAADSAARAPALRFVIALVGDLCACAVITLYCGMAAYAVGRAFFSENESRARFGSFLLADGFGLLLKIIFIILPIFVFHSNTFLPQIIALFADTILSRILILFSLKKSACE